MSIVKITGETGKKYISNITVPTTANPSGENFEIKDGLAWNKINELVDSVTKVMNFRANFTNPNAYISGNSGPTYKDLYYDGSSEETYPYGIPGTEDYNPRRNAEPGDIIIVGNVELIWNGNQWNEFGSTGSLKALAFEDTVKSKYTPKGQVLDGSTYTIDPETGTAIYQVPEFHADPVNIITKIKPPTTGNKWTVSVPDYSNENVSFSGSFQPSGNVDININTYGTGTQGQYTPQGTVSYSPNTKFYSSETQNWPVKNTLNAGSMPEDAKYVPSGQLNLNTNIDFNYTDIPKMVVGSNPSWTATVQNENLTIGWNPGAVTDFRKDEYGELDTYSVVNGTNTITTQGNFAGTPVYLSSYGRPYVDAENPTFTGESVYFNGTMAANNNAIPVTVTGSITSSATINRTVTAEGSTSFASDNYTPRGSIYTDPNNKGLVFVGAEETIISTPSSSS